VTTVAVDTTGGVRAPEEIIRGVAQASLDADLQILVVGDERTITKRLAETRHNPEHIEVIHVPAAQSVIDAAVKLAGEGRADVVVSAGASARAVDACRVHWRLLPGVRHPALSAVYPTALRHGERSDPFALLLDIGATLEADAETLCSFAWLGAAYAGAISQNKTPRVALLSIGEEPSRTIPAVAQASARLQRTKGFTFIGPIEAVDIPKGDADVVVCSGLMGNAVIRLLDGVNELVVDLARYAQKQRLLWRLGLGMLSGGLAQLKRLTDWEQYGGAPLLGYERLLLRAHPQSQARAIQNACRVAAKAVAADLPRRFADLRRSEVEEWTPPAAAPSEGSAA
jgi:glycerol-3-phosphate acyltransferase PlsX